VTEKKWSQVGSRGQYAELLAARAVALSSNGSGDLALEVLQQAETTSRENEASALCTSIRALFTVELRDSLTTILPRLRETVSRGVLDPFVFAFRLNRRLPREVARIPAMRSALQEALSIVDGQELSTRGTGPRHRIEDAGLTDRELEVLDLLGEAKTNKEIAQALFLSDSTVKVHVGNVLRKIGARTRTEAAIYAVTTRQREVPDDPQAPGQDPGPELTT